MTVSTTPPAPPPGPPVTEPETAVPVTPELEAASVRAEARRGRWTTAALWVIAGLLAWLVVVLAR